MSTVIVTVRADALRALLLLAGKKDRRNYLNGVCFETEQRCLVATNGHALLAVKADFEPRSTSVARFIVSREDCERAIKLTTKKNPFIAVSLSRVQPNDGPRMLELTTDAGQVLVREMDGRFPDWSRLVISKPSGEVAKFDPDLVATMCDALSLVTKARVVVPEISMNGGSAALVTCHDSRVLGVLMPYRYDESPELIAQQRLAALCNFGFVRAFDEEEQQAA